MKYLIDLLHNLLQAGALFCISLSFVNYVYCHEKHCSSKNTKFLSVTQIIDTKIIEKDPLVIEGLSLPEWMKQTIAEELAQFESYSQADWQRSFEGEWESCAHFRIKERRLSVKVPPFFLQKFQFPKVIILCTAIYRLIHAKGSQLKNGEFLVCLLDGVDQSVVPYPILCFSKKRGCSSVLIPDWFSFSDEFPRNNPTLLESIFQQKEGLIQDVDEGVRRYPWALKINMAFWRGGAHGINLQDPVLWRTNPRVKLVYFSMDYPHLVFARFLDSRFRGVCDELKGLKSALTAPWLSPMHSCAYKYQIDVDGWASGYHRCQWVLHSNCVPVKQESEYVQWYYSGLKPYVHYIPYLPDCSDLAEKIDYLQKHDEMAYQIARAGQEFYNQCLSREMTYLYLHEVLKGVLAKWKSH